MVENEFSESLRALNEKWLATKPMSEDNIPDGLYQLRIEEASLNPQQKDDGIIVLCVMKYVVMTPGDYQNKLITTYDRINTEQGMGFFKEKLKRLQIDPNTPLDELEPILTDLPNTLVTARVRNTPGKQGDRIFTNVYIQRVDGRDMSMGGM